MLSHFQLSKQLKRLRYVIFVGLIVFLFNVIRKSDLFHGNPRRSCSEPCPFSSIALNHSLHFDSSHVVRHFPDFVCPQNFRNLADWVFTWPDQFQELMEVPTTDGRMMAPCLPPGSIIYVRIWVIGDFFDKVYPNLTNNFVLITGEGDLSSPQNLDYLERPDSKIIHWFGQNGQYNVSKGKKFTHIPIGINCYEMADAINGVYSKHPNVTYPPIFNDKDEPISYVQPLDVSQQALATTIPTDRLVLVNFSPYTDQTGHRRRVWNDFCESNGNSRQTFIFCKTKPGGVQIANLPNIYNASRHYPFWLSPRGNGIDCHRTWEALYLDIIPIVWNSSLNVLYENLPVLIINDHRELNEAFLREKLKEISTKKVMKNGKYQFEKLRNAYWRRLILSKSRHGSVSDVHQRTNQCWRANNPQHLRST